MTPEGRLMVPRGYNGSVLKSKNKFSTKNLARNTTIALITIDKKADCRPNALIKRIVKTF